VPLAEMFRVCDGNPVAVEGAAAYSMEPFRFEPVPANIVAGILDVAKGKPAARALTGAEIRARADARSAGATCRRVWLLVFGLAAGSWA